MSHFHATTRAYSAGEVVVAEHPTTFYRVVVAALEAQRPAEAPSRDVCVFSAETAFWACDYIESQLQAGEPYRLYEVEHLGKHARAPMRLVHEIENRMRDGQPYDVLLAEYWSPSLHWHFMKWFGPAMRIVREVLRVADDGVLRTHQRWRDLDQSKRM